MARVLEEFLSVFILLDLLVSVIMAFYLDHSEKERKKPVTKDKRKVTLASVHSQDTQVGILAPVS